MDTKPGAGTFVEVEHDGGHLGTTVVEALAEATATESTEMQAELNSVVDPDALDSLFAPCPDGSPRSGGSIVFELEGHRIRVDADDETVVRVE